MRHSEITGCAANMGEDVGQHRARLAESFNKSVPLQWADKSDNDIETNYISASFDVGEGKFTVNFKRDYLNGGMWLITFNRNGTLDLTGTGSAHTVLSTVLSAIREFILTHDPQHISFSAKKSDASRLSLYPKLMALMQREFPQYTQPGEYVRSTTHHAHYELERPRRHPVPSPGTQPAPVEPHEPMSDGDWEALDDFVSASQAARRTR